MSDGALKVGDVYVVVTASIGQFSKSMKQVADDVAKAAKKVEAFGNKMGEIGSRIAIGLAGALAASASFGGEVSNQLDRLKSIMLTFGASIGDALAPMLKKLADALQSALGWFQRLDPSVREGVAKFLLYGAAAGAAGMVLGKVAGAIGAVAEVTSNLLIPAFTKGLQLFGLASVPVLAIVAAVAALVFVAGAVYKAWNDTGSGFGQTLHRMWEGVKGIGAKIAEVFKGLFDWLRQGFIKMLDAVAFVFRGIAALLAKMGVESAKGFEFLTGEKLADGMGSALSDVWDGVKSGAAYAFDGVKEMGADVADYLKKQFGDIFGGAQGKLRSKRVITVDKSSGFDQKGLNERMLNIGRDPVAEAYSDMLATKARKAAEALAKSVKAAVAQLTAKITNALGTAGSLFESAVQGFEAAGPLGAAAAVVGDLLTQSETFQRLVAMLNGFLQVVADTLGRVLAPVLPTLAAAFNVVAPILQALVPALEMVMRPVQALAPILQTLATLMQGLSPVITMLSQMLVAFMQPLTVLAGPVMKSFFQVVKYLGLGILYVVKGISSVWNGFVSAVQWVFKALGKIPFVGDFFDGLAKKLNSWKVPMDEVNSAIDTLANTSYDAAAATAAASAAQWQQASAAKEATDALTNVPQGFKLALARFTADDGVVPGASASVGWGSGSVPPPPATSTTNQNITINVNGATDAAEVARQVRIELKTSDRRRRGTDVAGYGYSEP